jgi:DNA polymerase II small subunit
MAAAKRSFHSDSAHIEADLKFKGPFYGSLMSSGAVSDFERYFRSRFAQLEGILHQRVDARDSSPIVRVLKQPANTKIRFIGMVTERKESTRQILLRVEDETAQILVFVDPSHTDLADRSRRILLDEVVLISGTKMEGERVIADEILQADVPDRRPKRATQEVYAVLISDLHVGSKAFLSEPLSRFILWLNGKIGDEKQQEIASKVKYLIIAGDIIDGIGVYPEQEKELEIFDVREQYEVAAQYIEQVPDYIEVIIIPGNHDATRQALPQPPITQRYAKSIYDSKRIRLVGNPARVVVHGVSFLIYHGRSLDDVIGSLPNVTYQSEGFALKSMEALLRARHLAPTYGGRTPIAPTTVDSLVIEEAPDVLHCGHVHVFGFQSYRGTLMVNSGAFQGQTDYQRRMGLTPRPGVAAALNLQTLHVHPIDFNV